MKTKIEQALSTAVTCTILAAAGPQRSRVLANLYKDHMRLAGDVCFSQVFSESGGTVGIVDYTNYDDMKYAIRKLDDSEFRNAFSRAYIRVKEYKQSLSRSRSRSRSYSKVEVVATAVATVAVAVRANLQKLSQHVGLNLVLDLLLHIPVQGRGDRHCQGSHCYTPWIVS